MAWISPSVVILVPEECRGFLIFSSASWNHHRVVERILRRLLAGSYSSAARRGIQAVDRSPPISPPGPTLVASRGITFPQLNSNHPELIPRCSSHFFVCFSLLYTSGLLRLLDLALYLKWVSKESGKMRATTAKLPSKWLQGLECLSQTQSRAHLLTRCLRLQGEQPLICGSHPWLLMLSEQDPLPHLFSSPFPSRVMNTAPSTL
jgi:hypothetical protein